MRVASLKVSELKQLIATDPARARTALAELESQDPTAAAKLRESLEAKDRSVLGAAWSKAAGTAHAGDLAATVRTQVNAVRYESTKVADAPLYRGTVVVNEGKAQLKTAEGTFDLAADGKAPWNLRWSGELSSFEGQVLTVRGQPAKSGKTLMVQEFAPGTSADFISGRVLLKDDGVYVNVRPGKQVKVMNPELAEVLKDWEKVAFILPGTVDYSEELSQWQFEGSPDSVYLLTKLNPGEGVYYADTPFERVNLTAAENLGGVLPNEKMGQRIFVHGQLLKKPATAETPHRRYFQADWVGNGIRPDVVARGEALTAANEFPQQPASSSPAVPKGLRADFEPRLDAVPRGTKHGVFSRPGSPPVQERWFEGRKLAEGPVDAQGRAHGGWREYSAVPIEGEVNAQGEAPLRYVETLRGEYEHGQRTGVWTQLIDGRPANAWQWENGKLRANGHLDAEGRPHDAWTLVAEDGFRDGGEGIYSHGKQVSRWNWYAAGTTDYQRCELYHPNGQLAAKGDERGVRGDDGIVTTYRVGTWQFFDPAGKPLGEVTYRPDQSVDVEQQGPLGNGSNWQWDKAPPPD